MNENLFETIEKSCGVLQLPFSAKEFAQLAEEHSLSAEAAQAVALIFEHMQQKKIANTILALLRFSRLPLKNPKTFQNFDFSVLRGKNVEQIRNLHLIFLCSGERMWSRYETCRRWLLSMHIRI